MTEGVRNFLRNLGMGKYYDVFSAKGFNLETDIPHLTQSDLKDTLMVTSDEEREIILYSARRFKTSSEHFVYEWLRRHSLDHYFVNFIQSGFLSLETVSNIQLPNEDLYDELEIVLPGHKKRLERAVVSLRQEIQRRSVAEKPVTQGWWGKPRCLPQAKFDFLCVEGTLFSRHEPNKRATIDFMVDSGSDVSTVQEQTLSSLNLDLVGPVYSCGIHGGNHTNLYRAQLLIGGHQMTVEVIASNYDSLGSRIVRHFRHVIDGNRHIWLKGNYVDPVPPVLPLKVPSSTPTPKQLNGPAQILSIEQHGPETVTASSKTKDSSPSKHKEYRTNIPVTSEHSTPLTTSSSSSSSSLSSSSPKRQQRPLTPPGSNIKDSLNQNTTKSCKSDTRDDVANGIGSYQPHIHTLALSRSESHQSVKQDVSRNLVSKRPLDISDKDGEDASRPKLVKLQGDDQDLLHCSRASSSPPPSSPTQHSSQQHALPLPIPLSQHALPIPPSQHIQANSDSSPIPHRSQQHALPLPIPLSQHALPIPLSQHALPIPPSQHALPLPIPPSQHIQANSDSSPIPHRSQQHALPLPIPLSQHALPIPPSQHALPIPPSQHIQTSRLSSSDHTSPSLRDTDDDVDNIYVDRIYAKYLPSTHSSLLSLSPSPSSFKSSSSSSDSHFQYNYSQKFLSNVDSPKSLKSDIHSHSCPSEALNEGEISGKGISQPDVIHIHSGDDDNDDGDNDDDVDGIDESVVRVREEERQRHSNVSHGRNFIPSNHSSSVTISIMDLDEEDWD